MKHMMTLMDAGAVLVAGVFGNAGPQLRLLFEGKGSGSPIHQSWIMKDEDDVCTYPAYWVILGKHKNKASNSTQVLPRYQQMMELSIESNESRRPFESAMLPVRDVPQWTVHPGSAVADAKKVGLVKSCTPNFKWWNFGIYQLPVWLGGSRTGKKDTADRKAKKTARKRQRQAEKRKGKGTGDGKGKAGKRKGKGWKRKGKAS